LQLIECFAVGGGALRLDQRRSIPPDPQPAQILIDFVDELGPAARLVEILDPQVELAAALQRPRLSDRGAIGVPEVQQSRRRRSEAGRKSSFIGGGGSAKR